MKVLQPGRPQQGWSTEATCTGKGNGDGGCGARLLVDLFAGLGFIAVFAGATNTPLACTLMGIELFGAEHAVFFALACFVAYFCSGHTGIYHAQRIGVPKHGAGGRPTEGRTLRELREP